MSSNISSTVEKTAAAPPTLLEAFATSAAQLRHFGIPRIRVVGLSEGCTQADYEKQRSRPDGKDMETLLQESTLRGPHGALGAASHRVQSEAEARAAAQVNEDVPIVTEQEFMHKFVFHSRPCVILDAIASWPAVEKWRDDRYVFDLDHTLPLEPEREPQEEEEEDEEEQDDGEDTNPNETEKARSSEKACEANVSDAAAPVLAPKKVTVALTPNGRADAATRVTYSTTAVPAEDAAAVYTGTEAQKHAVMLPSADIVDADKHVRCEKIFMYAAELRMTLPQLYGLLQRSPLFPPANPIEIDMRTYADKSQAPAIAYAQLQNNCLNTEYNHLHVDIGSNVERFGCRVFDKDAVEAANVWFGIPASVSSMHQDWVENLYAVVRGVKEFVMIPPWEGPFVPKPEIPAAAFAIDEAQSVVDHGEDTAQSWSLQFKQYPVKDGTTVPWMDFDITGAEVEDDAEGVARAELKRRLVEQRCETSALWAAPMCEDEAVAAAEEEAARKPLHPLVAYVHPGETLYLPAMWLHRVAQHADSTDMHARAMHHAAAAAAAVDPANRAPTTEPPLPLIAAVNYWYDMSFGNPSVVMLREFGLLL
ncbi:hypothetical protein ABB37_00928 [Leptomonas pyrrhocoris]|uniref:JmjC domain-containing protein n=1 Tax=Leptomonas pyrrhocoris TaxID=157538 RepID=A0A0M9GBE2_LEPPY|nr:hypothetical protein ABB37_00928 [Leptomonas pyrrhocoris]KPA86887.1 hypothetical protein ABB37_00928 [Leptomonas pyrrhocoris]|eukprot:XP_015665326.1 hypothetical protein ABB37_00928 [Leptomonas pyrrhocoris]